MNRSRNRQPRPNRQSNREPSRGGRAQAYNRYSDGSAPATPQQASGTVPLARNVRAGASVYIILKEDQSTGRETQGVVQDVLTSGDHWRGVKVRLQGGLVGRVQRLADHSNNSTGTAGGERAAGDAAREESGGSSRFTMRYRDIREEEALEMPPPRSLADYMQFPDAGHLVEGDGNNSLQEAGIPCPICEVFEGDEAAVTHHVEREHF